MERTTTPIARSFHVERNLGAHNNTDRSFHVERNLGAHNTDRSFHVERNLGALRDGTGQSRKGRTITWGDAHNQAVTTIMTYPR